MKILVTGFTPFGGEQINPSWEAARRLPNRIGGAELIKHEIPTEFDASGAALHKLLTELRPDAVLCVGQYGGANCIRVERVAINLRDARIADNAGKQPTDEPVVAGGPDAYFATIPTREIVDALREQNIPAQLSYSAGTFVCNNLLYCALHESAQSYPALRCGFNPAFRFPLNQHGDTSFFPFTPPSRTGFGWAREGNFDSKSPSRKFFFPAFPQYERREIPWRK